MSCGAWGGKSPWKVKTEEEEDEEPVTSLVEIMSEELAHSLVEEDERKEESLLRHLAIAHAGQEFDNDEDLAKALQREFDREYELSVSLEQKSLKGTNKEFPPTKNSTSVVMTPDRYCPRARQGADSEDESDGDDDHIREAATSLLYAKLDEAHLCGQRLMRDEQGDLVSKHDAGISGRRNADKTYNYNPTVNVGDMGSAEISNKVYNSLRAFSKADAKRQMRFKDKEERATVETSVDYTTRLLLYKWQSQGVFDRIEGVIATGKESAVLHGVLSTDEHLAVKVYKTALTEFKNRSEYVKEDFRFKNPRRVLKIWAEREFLNLKRMSDRGLPCPTPIAVKRNVLAMSFIGAKALPAPRLRNVEWEFYTEEERTEIFIQVKNIMMRMFKECHLVHADFGEFNLLFLDGKVYVIDVSQSMDISHPRHLHYLARDVNNVIRFFTNIGIPNMPTCASLFNEITDMSMKEDEDLSVQVDIFEHENRSSEVKEAKARPADHEWKLYNQERGRGKSPARDYN